MCFVVHFLRRSLGASCGQTLLESVTHERCVTLLSLSVTSSDLRGYVYSLHCNRVSAGCARSSRSAAAAYDSSARAALKGGAQPGGSGRRGDVYLTATRIVVLSLLKILMTNGASTTATASIAGQVAAAGRGSRPGIVCSP